MFTKKKNFLPKRLIFAMIGVLNFKDSLGYCESLDNIRMNKKAVLIIYLFLYSFCFFFLKKKCDESNKKWIIYPYNFDNVVNGMLTLFFISTFENFGKILAFTTYSNYQNKVFF